MAVACAYFSTEQWLSKEVQLVSAGLWTRHTWTFCSSSSPFAAFAGFLAFLLLFFFLILSFPSLIASLHLLIWFHPSHSFDENLNERWARQQKQVSGPEKYISCHFWAGPPFLFKFPVLFEQSQWWHLLRSQTSVQFCVSPHVIRTLPFTTTPPWQWMRPVLHCTQQRGEQMKAYCYLNLVFLSTSLPASPNLL